MRGVVVRWRALLWALTAAIDAAATTYFLVAAHPGDGELDVTVEWSPPPQPVPSDEDPEPSMPAEPAAAEPATDPLREAWEQFRKGDAGGSGAV